MRIRGKQSARPSAIVAVLVAAVAVVAASTPATHARVPSIRTVVVVKNAAGDNRPEAFVRAVGGHVLRSLDVIDGFIAAVPLARVASLAHAAGVRSVTPNQRL